MQLGTLNFSPNLYIFAIIGGFFVFAFLFGEARLKKIAMAILAGLFVADQLAAFAATQLAHAGIKNLDIATVKIALLILTAVPLSLGKAAGSGGRFSIRSFVLALLTAATLIAYTQSYMEIGLQIRLSTDYNLVAIAVANRPWWLAGLVLWLIILQVWKKKSKDDEDGGKKGKKKK